MGVKISGAIISGLKMRMMHEPSNTSVVTDPPLDNGGDATSFSPTDLVATALASCMMSVMAIAAKKDGLELSGMACSVEKHMSQDLPRRIIQLDVVIELPASLSQSLRTKYQSIADSCPVIQSLNSGISINKSYRFR